MRVIDMSARHDVITDGLQMEGAREAGRGDGRGRLPYLKFRNQGGGFPDFNLNFGNQGGESGDVISKTPTLTVPQKAKCGAVGYAQAKIFFRLRRTVLETEGLAASQPVSKKLGPNPVLSF